MALPYSTSKRERYGRLQQWLWSERSSFDGEWRSLADFVSPRRVRFQANDRNRGGHRNQHIIDSSARFAHRTLMSGMHAGLTSPARPWMMLTTPDPALAKFGPVKAWLHVVTQRMMAIFAQSNLYNVLPTVYGDMGLFATAAMSVLEDGEELMRCYSYPVGSYALGVDKRGRVTTFVRKYESTVRQVVEEFGVQRGYRDIDWSKLSAIVKDQWDRGDYELPVPLCHIVLPNEDADPNRLEAKYLPWSSCHFEETAEPRGELRFLRESGYRTFPILAPRWDVTSHEDSYGTDCPGMTALGDVKQLQLMQRRKGQAINKMVDPPLVGPSQLQTQKTSLLPGDITYSDEREGQKGLRAIHEIGLNLEHLVMDIRDVRFLIRRAFYEDLFLMLAQADPARGAQPATAREIEERHEEKLLALGPVLERTNDELLDPLVDRTYALMDANGLIPEPPEELDGVRLKVEYTSILAQAQKLVGLAGQDRFVMSVGTLAQAYPEARHKLDVHQAIDNYADMTGVDPRIVRSTEEAQERAGAEQQAAAAAQQAENTLQLAKAAQAAGNTPMGTDSALDRIVRGGAGG